MVRIHTFLQGGAFDGSFVTMLAPEIKPQIRVAMSDDITPHGDAPVETYSLIDSGPMPGMGGTNFQAAYRWVGSRTSPVSLIDYFIDV